jgi:HPt (histidine-containing phosphotransfer) domain-containing protein
MNLKALGEEIGLEEDEYIELVELFLETGAADYEQMKSAFQAGDAQQVARSAHTLSGAAGNLRIMNIHEMAKRIERAAGENQLATVGMDVDALKARFDEIARCVQV